MGARVKHAVFALLGCVFGFGASVTLHDGSSPLSASALSPAGAEAAKSVLRFTFSTAHADSKRRKRTRKRKAAARKAQKERQKAEDKKLLGTRSASLAASCAFDSYATIAHASETFVCGGYYFQHYEEDGVKGFEGHAVGTDRGKIKRAKARHAAAKKKRRAAAKKKLKESRRITLAANCYYDSYASVSSTTDLFACGRFHFRKYVEKGVSGFEAVKR